MVLTCKPKHVGAVLLILKCFDNSTFFNVVCVSWLLNCWILLMHDVTMKCWILLMHGVTMKCWILLMHGVTMKCWILLMHGVTMKFKANLCCWTTDLNTVQTHVRVIFFYLCNGMLHSASLTWLFHFMVLASCSQTFSFYGALSALAIFSRHQKAKRIT